MDETFRLRRRYRNIGAGGVLGFSAWAALGLWVAWLDPGVRHRGAATVLMGGVPLAMAGISLWLLAAYRRERLTVRGGRIVFRGVVRRKEFDLEDVFQARWVSGSDGVVLRTPETRLAVHLSNYEREERERLVGHLRSTVPPEVQTGWDDYAARRLRPPGGKPGPGEVLLRRGDWRRYFLPAVAAAAVGGVVGWRATGRWQALIAPLVPLAGWTAIRAATPAEGMVATRLTGMPPETARFFRFLTAWAAAAFAGLLLYGVAKDRLARPDATLTVGTAAWVAVLLFEAARHDLRSRRRRPDAKPCDPEPHVSDEVAA